MTGEDDGPRGNPDAEHDELQMGSRKSTVPLVETLRLAGDLIDLYREWFALMESVVACAREGRPLDDLLPLVEELRSRLRDMGEPVDGSQLESASDTVAPPATPG